MDKTKDNPVEGAKSPYIPKFTPRGMLASQASQLRLAIGVAGLALVFAAIVPFLLLDQMNKRQNVMVLDGSGTIHIGPLEKLSGSSPLFTEIVLQASKAMFERSKIGLENPELVTSLFRPQAIMKLNMDVKWQLPELAAKDMRQTANIDKITVLKEIASGNIRYFRVQGTLSSAGMVNGTPIAYSEPIVAIISMAPNPRVADKSRYPFLVGDFRIDSPPRPPGIYDPAKKPQQPQQQQGSKK